MKICACLLAVSLLGCLADPHPQQLPQRPEQHPPRPPQHPQHPPRPPQHPQHPPRPPQHPPRPPQLPEKPPQLPQRPEQHPLLNAQLPPGTPQFPPWTQQLPPGTPQFPPWTQQLPPGTQQLPPGTPQLPQRPPQTPKRPPQLPPWTPQLPSGTPQLPPGTPQFPPWTQQLPPGTPQLPSGTPHLPPRPPQLPQRPPQTPKRPPQLPQRPPQLPPRPPQLPPETKQLPSWTPQFGPRSPQLPQKNQHPKDSPPPRPGGRCMVRDHDKIPCGAHAMSGSECEAINCCFDGKTCFYGKAVTFQCTKDAQMIVVVARDATLPNIVFESIKFLAEDEKCNPVDVTSAFAIYQFPVAACGTVIMEENGVLIYENRMSSSFEVAPGPYGLITRDSNFELLMQCRYFPSGVTAVVVEVAVAPAPRPVAGLGPLDVELRLANGQCTTVGCVEESIAYNSFYVDSDYPVTKVLMDPVYVEVRMLERTDPNLILTLGRCWATSTPYPHSLPQWDLLIDGCPYSDERYRTALLPMYATTDVLYPTHHKRFVFKMFTFVMSHTIPKGPSSGARTPLKEQLTIHCETAVCIPALGYDCQPRCHRKERDVSSSGHRDSGEETVLVSSKEVVIIDPSRSLQY